MHHRHRETLVEHDASLRSVVLAPEHSEGFDGSLTGCWEELIDRPLDIQRTVDEAERLTAVISMAGDAYPTTNHPAP
jgi:hypothetical protein